MFVYVRGGWRAHGAALPHPTASKQPRCVVLCSSFAATGRHERSPANLLLAAHGGVDHFLAHRLLDGAHCLVARPIADCLLELRVELADRQGVPTLHLLYRIIELLLEPIHHFTERTSAHQQLVMVLESMRKLIGPGRRAKDTRSRS